MQSSCTLNVTTEQMNYFINNNRTIYEHTNTISTNTKGEKRKCEWTSLNKSETGFKKRSSVWLNAIVILSMGRMRKENSTKKVTENATTTGTGWITIIQPFNWISNTSLHIRTLCVLSSLSRRHIIKIRLSFNISYGHYVSFQFHRNSTEFRFQLIFFLFSNSVCKKRERKKNKK